MEFIWGEFWPPCSRFCERSLILFSSSPPGRFLLICLIHAASVSCLLETQGERHHGGGAGRAVAVWACAHPLLSAAAKLFLRQDGGAGGAQGAPQPQNQLRQAPVRPVDQSRTGGGYRPALTQVPQNGRPLKSVVQSRPPPPPPPGSDQKVTRRPTPPCHTVCGTVS